MFSNVERKKSTSFFKKSRMINNIFLFSLWRDAFSLLANTILFSVNNYYWLTTYTYSTKPSLLRIYAFQSIHPTSRLLCALEHPYYTMSTNFSIILYRLVQNEKMIVLAYIYGFRKHKIEDAQCINFIVKCTLCKWIFRQNIS